MAILTLVIAAVFAALFFAAKKAPHPCRLLAPSALAVCACAVCLSATTYAWFSATSTSQVATIQAATYDVTVNGYETTNGVYTVTLDATRSYPVMLTAGGTATTGYCKVVLTQSDGTEITKYTPQFPQIIDTVVNNVYMFSVSGYTSMTITPTWGELPTGAALIEGGALSSGTATTDLFAMFMMPEPPETPDETETTYPVENDTVDPTTTPVTQATPPATEPPAAPVVPESLPETDPVTPE